MRSGCWMWDIGYWIWDVGNNIG